jgi:hypothetical protein
MIDIDARLAYDVWMRVIRDEELADAVLSGSYAQLAAERGMDAEAVRVLDALHAHRGTRWNLENLYYRAISETLAKLYVYLPCTISLLTNGNEDWARDLCGDYLSRHGWNELGHLYLEEADRFVKFVRTRVMKRRVTHEHLEQVLTFESAWNDLLRRTRDVPASGWPRRDIAWTDELVADAMPRPGPLVEWLSLPINFLEWIRNGNTTATDAKPEPVTLVLWIPSLEEARGVQRVSEGTHEVFDRCDGKTTTLAVADSMAEDFDLDRASVVATVRRWLQGGVLVTSPT